MKKIFLFIFVTLSFLLISCNGKVKNEESFKEYISPDKSYSFSIPASLKKDSRSRSDLMAFTKENAFIYIRRQQEASLDENEININQNGDKFTFDLVEETDSTKLYKYSQGLLVLYEYYLIKKLQCGNYLIIIKDNTASKDQITNIGLKIYSSLKDYCEEMVNDEILNEESKTSLEKSFSTFFYSIKYPRGWQVQENLDEMTEAYIGYQPDNFGFTITRFETDYSLSDINEDGKQDLRQAGFKILGEKLMEVDGAKCYRALQMISIQKQKVKNISYTFKKGNMLYNIKFGNVTAKEHEILASEIMNSFRFK